MTFHVLLISAKFPFHGSPPNIPRQKERETLILCRRHSRTEEGGACHGLRLDKPGGRLLVGGMPLRQVAGMPQMTEQLVSRLQVTGGGLKSIPYYQSSSLAFCCSWLNKLSYPMHAWVAFRKASRREAEARSISKGCLMMTPLSCPMAPSGYGQQQNRWLGGGWGCAGEPDKTSREVRVPGAPPYSSRCYSEKGNFLKFTCTQVSF